MIKSLEMIRDTYGSAEQYVVDHCKVSPAHVEQLRRNLTVDVSAAEPVLDWREHAKLLNVSPAKPVLEEKEHAQLVQQGEAPIPQSEAHTPKPSL